MKNPVKKPAWVDEFIAFAVKGNAMALAVGTIIGAAFSTITASLTNDVIMPIVAIFMGGIDFSELKLTLPRLFGEAPLDEATSFGRNFARSGGVTQAVQQTIKERGLEADFKPVVCNGLTECEMALRKLKVNRLDGNFLEGMACEGGCVQGAGCFVRSPRNRMDVENHAKQAEGRTILETVRSMNGETTQEEPVAEEKTAKAKSDK